MRQRARQPGTDPLEVSGLLLLAAAGAALLSAGAPSPRAQGADELAETPVPCTSVEEPSELVRRHHRHGPRPPLLGKWKERQAGGPAFLRGLHFDSRYRLYWFDSQLAGDGPRRRALALGGVPVDLETGRWRGLLSLRLALMGSLKLEGEPDEDGTGILARGQESYAVVGIGEVDLHWKRSRLTLGRQLLDMPFVNACDSRMTPNSFSGAWWTLSGERSRWSLGAGYVHEMKPRNSSHFISLSEAAGASGIERGMATLAVSRRSETWSAGALVHVVPEVWAIVHVNARKSWRPGGRARLELAAQYSEQRSLGDDPLTGEDFRARSAGLKLTAGRGGLSAHVAWSSTASQQRIRAPYGQQPSYHYLMQAAFDRAGEDAALVGLSHDFERGGATGLRLILKHAWSSGSIDARTREPLPDRRETDFTVDYHFPVTGRFDGLRLRARYSVLDGGPGQERSDQVRLIVDYTLPVL